MPETTCLTSEASHATRTEITPTSQLDNSPTIRRRIDGVIRGRGGTLKARDNSAYPSTPQPIREKVRFQMPEAGIGIRI